MGCFYLQGYLVLEKVRPDAYFCNPSATWCSRWVFHWQDQVTRGSQASLDCTSARSEQKQVDAVCAGADSQFPSEVVAQSWLERVRKWAANIRGNCFSGTCAAPRLLVRNGRPSLRQMSWLKSSRCLLRALGGLPMRACVAVVLGLASGKPERNYNP